MRKSLRKSEIKELNEKIKDFDVEFSKKDNVELINDIYIVNHKPTLFLFDGIVLPTLKLLQEKPDALKQIIVDMGAVKFVTSGADVMRPGITDVEKGIEKNEFVVVVDENNKKPLSVCQAMFSGDEMEKMSSGKVLKNIHFVGDKIWQV